MFAVTGQRTTIVKALEQLTGEETIRIDPTVTEAMRWGFEIPPTERYVLAAGVLHGAQVSQITQWEAQEAFQVNLWSVLNICETVLSASPRARICVIGTESVPNGSYDRLYAATKAGVHQYVQTRKVYPPQQLVCVSPTIIIDSGMTQRRPDLERVIETRQTVRAIDVARVIQRVLWDPLNLNASNIIIPVKERSQP